MFAVTLKQLRAAGACYEGYNKVVRMLQGKPFTEKDTRRESYIRFAHKEEISLINICNNNGIDDALWATQCLVCHDRDLRLYAVWCARQVQHLMADQRSIDALDAAERYANEKATRDELHAASAAAWDAAWAAARDAAWDAAQDAAWAAARDAAWDAARAARDAARYDARDAARDAARAAQKDMFIAMCEGRAPWQLTKHD